MILFICYAIAYKLDYVIYHSSNFTGLVDQLVTLHTLLQFRLLVNFSYLCVHTCVCEGGGGAFYSVLSIISSRNIAIRSNIVCKTVRNPPSESQLANPGFNVRNKYS